MPTSDDNGPVNLLALDGGGIRGVSELVTLHEIMLEIQRRDGLDSLPKPCDYFHLIGGTSTGGLIAIMLGRLRMSTAEALDEYDGFAKKIFRFRNRKMNFFERFGATEIEKAVREIVARCGQKDLMLDPGDPSANKCRAFVCAMPAGRLSQSEPRLLRTYEVEDGRGNLNCTIWEAARATSAAPTYFKPLVITGADGNTETLVDGAMSYNNPSAWLLKEATEIFDRTRPLGCVVSLGTGTKASAMERASSALSFGWALNMHKVMKDMMVDCEKQHSTMEAKFEGTPDTYFRFNVPDGAAKVGLAEYKKMGKLKDMTQAYLREGANREAIGKVADILRKDLTRGITVGHIVRLDKDLIITSKRNAIPKGLSSDNFTGRRRILDRMDAFFSSRSDLSSRRQMLLYGMGGIGKTQIALKFAEEHQERFGNNVFWADATDQITLEQSYQAIEKKIYKDRSEKSTSVTGTVAWLEEATEDWFLVLDNYDDSTDLTRFLPSARKGNVLYTSRQNSLKMSLPTEAAIMVDIMEQEDAVTLLLRAAKNPPETPDLRRRSMPVVEELGSLPLAIDQAGSYINMMGITFEKYLDILRARKNGLLRDERFVGSDPRSMPVYASFDLSYDAIVAFTKTNRKPQMAQDARHALQVLSMICFYHNHEVMEDMIGRAAVCRHKLERNQAFPLAGGELSPQELMEVDETTTEWVPDKFHRGTYLLERFSLVQWNKQDQLISMHVLVHSWRRDTMSQEERHDCGLAARCILFDAITFKFSIANIRFLQRLIPHVFACLTWVVARHEDPILESEYDQKLADVMKDIGRLTEAEAALRRSYLARRAVYGKDHYATVLAAINLGVNLASQGRFAEAEPLLLDAVEKRVKQYGPDHNATIKAKWGLACLYSAQARFDEYEPLVRELYEARRNENSRDDIKRLRLWPLEGILRSIKALRNGEYGLVGTLSMAEERFEETQRLVGPTHPRTLSAKSAVAECLRASGNLVEAEYMFMKIYQHYKELYVEEDHPQLIEARNNVARCFNSQGRCIEAEGLSVYNLAMFEMSGQEEVDLGSSIKDCLAYALVLQGRMDEAIEVVKEALADREARLGPDHLATTFTRKAVGMYESFRDGLTPFYALEMRRKAVKTSRLALGDDAPDWMVKEYEEAEVFDKRVEDYLTGDEKADEWIKENVIIPAGLKPKDD